MLPGRLWRRLIDFFWGGEPLLMRIRVKLGQVVAEGELFEDRAPRTARALWERLPIRDRTIQARWSGDAWRTEQNYELLDKDAPVENPAGRLSAGDIIYYPGYKSGLLKVAIAYGQSQWLAPFMVPLPVTYLGKLDTNVDAFVERCQRIIFDGPLDVEISRAGGDGL